MPCSREVLGVCVSVGGGLDGGCSAEGLEGCVPSCVPCCGNVVGGVVLPSSSCGEVLFGCCGSAELSAARNPATSWLAS